MKGGRILFYCLSMCAVTIIGIIWYVQKQDRKTAVVDAVKLFDQFDMKKELEAKTKIRLQSINKQLDSIGNSLKIAKATNNEEDVKKLSYAYGDTKNSLETEYKQSNHDIDEQVWKRLNVIVADFGKKEGLRIIIGANGMGTVLYVDDNYDITNELVKYSNRKYGEGN